MSANDPLIWQVSEYPKRLGGIEQYVHASAIGLSKRSFRQTLVYDAGHRPDSEYLEAFTSRRGIECIAELESLAKEQKPDAVMIHRPFGEGMLGALLRIAPVLRYVHDHDLVCPRRHKYFPISKHICEHRAGPACVVHGCLLGRSAYGRPKLLSLKRRLSDIREHGKVGMLLVAGSFMKEELIANGLPEDKIRILPPLPGDFRREQGKYHEELSDILYVGQLIRGKGVDLLLRAAARIAGRWRLHIVGEGNMQPELERLASRLGIIRRTVFAGRLDRVSLSKAYDQAALASVPSRWAEPFGMVGLEAMAAARPIVASSAGGIRDWLRHGINGLASPVGDIAAMAENMKWLLDNPSLAKDLGENGREILDRHFDFESNMDRLESIIREAIR